VAEISGTIDGQDVAGTVGSASLTSEKEATLTITKDYKVVQSAVRCTRCLNRFLPGAAVLWVCPWVQM
jgi:hypothetical protein